MNMGQALLSNEQSHSTITQSQPVLHVVDKKVTAAHAIAEIRAMLGKSRAIPAYNKLK